ncbi:hypothetical protein MNBD_ALPHA11-1595, partial [hydrothermal vent metagenome]
TKQAEESVPTILSIDIAPPANIAALSNIAPLPDSAASLPMELIIAPIDDLIETALPIETALIKAEPPEITIFEVKPSETVPSETVPVETAPVETVPVETVLPETVKLEPFPLENTIITPDPVEKVISVTLPDSEQIILSEENSEKEAGTEEVASQDLDAQDLSVREEPIVEEEITRETNIKVVEREVLQVEVFESDETVAENFEVSQQEIAPIALAAIAPQNTQTNIVAEADIDPVLDRPAQEAPPIENEKILQQEQTELINPQSDRMNTPILRAVIVGDPEESRFTSGKVIIRTGDNLWTIASRVYGMGRRYVEIYEANIDQISNPHWIFPGQIFDLPEN